MKTILVYMENTNGVLDMLGRELLFKASQLAQEIDATVQAVTIGDVPDSQFAGYDIVKAHIYSSSIEYFEPNYYASLLLHCVQATEAYIVLIGASLEGRSIAPHISASCNTGLTADCTSLYIDDDGHFVQVRPAFGGNLMAEIITANNTPKMATVRAKIFPPAQPVGDVVPPIVRTSLASNSAVVVNSRQTIDNVDISSASIVVAIGGAIKTKQEIEDYQAFADKIGAVLCCSRVLVERGLMPIDRQIGLSGRSVAPQLLITFGISGSVQFCAGIASAGKIVAVNNDAEANMCKIAHYSIVADMHQLIRKLL